MALPSNVGTGIVRIRMRRTLFDLSTAPATSELVSLQGSVTFTPSTKLLTNAANGLMIPTIPVTVHLDASGNADVTLMATDDPDQSPVNWTYEVSFSLEGVQIDPFSISVPEGSDQELADIIPVPSADGTFYIPGGPKDVTFSMPGTIAVVTGKSRLYNDTMATRTITKVRSAVGTAPNTSLIVDVKKGGTTIFPTTAKPTITVGTYTATAVPDTTAWASGEYLTVDVTQIGSPATDLTVTISYG